MLYIVCGQVLLETASHLSTDEWVSDLQDFSEPNNKQWILCGSKVRMGRAGTQTIFSKLSSPNSLLFIDNLKEPLFCGTFWVTLFWLISHTL